MENVLGAFLPSCIYLVVKRASVRGSLKQVRLIVKYCTLKKVLKELSNFTVKRLKGQLHLLNMQEVICWCNMLLRNASVEKKYIFLSRKGLMLFCSGWIFPFLLCDCRLGENATEQRIRDMLNKGGVVYDLWHLPSQWTVVMFTHLHFWSGLRSY